MPQVDVTFSGLIKQELGQRAESRELPEGATLGDLVQALDDAHGGRVRDLLLDERGSLHSYALVAVNGTSVRDLASPVSDGRGVVRILVMSPMMIGG